ncbi:MAG: DUF2945 domain-containing protein [Alphaproteobacteria bacterium]
MAASFQTGDRVEWNWGAHTANGTIRKVHTEDVTATLKGSEITRHASAECPAYTIEQEDGDVVLKSQSEIWKAK